MLAENLGRLFEVGFNIGILAYIEQNQIPHHYGDMYRRDLERLKLPKMTKRLAGENAIISEEGQKNLDKWSEYFIQKGFLGGMNFFREYLDALGWQKNRLKDLDILYYQCCFTNQNSIGNLPKNESEELPQLLAQLGVSDWELVNRKYGGRKNPGEFLHADTLMLLRYRREYRILCVDLSVFSIQEAEDLQPLNNVETLRQMLGQDIGYIRSKSVFSKLRIDTGDADWDFSRDLRRYFTAFKRKDKESAKLIQAASYAHSFYGFLRERGILTEETSLVFNVVGYSDRHISTISARPEHLHLLEACADIYKKEPKDVDIKVARSQVLAQIKRNAAASFTDGKKFLQELYEKPIAAGDGITAITHTEHLSGEFCNTAGILPDELAAQLDIPPGLTLRDAHAHLITTGLNSDDECLFLTGNPGIGKTTAIANFLQAHSAEGFLLIYISPRTQVNHDLIQKFHLDSQTHQPTNENLFCLHTNANIIQDNGGLATVEYHSQRHSQNFTAKTVNFINAKQRPETPPPHPNQRRLGRINEDRIKDKGRNTEGVLSTLCQGIHAIIDGQISNQIVATVAIQSLRVSANGEDTLRHLDNIFKSAANQSKPIPAKMRAISQRIKHIFIMIDEITGDDSGVNFFTGVRKFLQTYQLEKHGFNSKIIIADASIVDKEVITQHLTDTTPEPDKIYFRPAKQAAAPLSMEQFRFKRRASRIINANSYPASSLEITYKLFVECCRYHETLFEENSNNAIKSIQSQITTDITNLLNRPDAGQVLVYIQDKRRLQEIIEKIAKQRARFKPNIDYLEIHANLSDDAKRKIHQYQQDVQVVFMTSSASRGLSFPKAKHILVEIPRFQIERNLMEAIQVIYRARGDANMDQQQKHLVFYAADRAIYYPQNPDSTEDYTEERKLSLQESILNLLNLMLILKISMMTRIVGSWRLGFGSQKEAIMIPIGGKSVAAAGNTFTGEMTNLIREMKNEHRRQPGNQTLKEVYTSLQELLSQAEFVLIDENGYNGTNSTSYLHLREQFHSQFTQACRQLDNLLAFGNAETAHITGSLLVVPIDKSLQETYAISLEQQIRKYATDAIRKKMWAISKSEEYPENLRAGLRRGATELLDLLRGDIQRTQWLEQNSQNSDQYYAIPLFSFISSDTLKEYFKSNPQEPEENEFRTLLSRYVHSLYPAYNTLPIGRQYREFPFLIFRSYSLAEMRYKIYTDKYLFNSYELNILNLIL
ncbi:MAG TPA: helicase [Oscillatoriaceae cyanobacterium M33_DOE_052]|uniref:Helicase n=1 Tax=Planktothricoides sp. SpSt-374 TaxID=2282167 RepID=A0A7C3VHK5_9CYAN|nr:helicase [Oscillatoriaceae cyanobacterium M33_DOE_052]